MQSSVEEPSHPFAVPLPMAYEFTNYTNDMLFQAMHKRSPLVFLCFCLFFFFFFFQISTTICRAFGAIFKICARGYLFFFFYHTINPSACPKWTFLSSHPQNLIVIQSACYFK
jgi:hypothetical protein